MKGKSEEIKVDIHTLGYYLERALCVMIRCLNKELKEYKLGFQHSDFTILKVLSQTDGLSQTELARILGKEKSGISRSLFLWKRKDMFIGLLLMAVKIRCVFPKKENK